MRTTIIACLCLMLASCMFNSNYKEPNMPSAEVVKSQITTVLDSMHSAFQHRQFKKMMNYLSEDGYYLGSDPKELWTKQQLSDYFKPHETDSATFMPYEILRRDILLNEDRNSAAVVEQYYLVKMSDKVMVRAISRVSKKENGWIIDLYSLNMIPRNEDIDKINNSLKQ
jgi:hypothetical protein